MKSAPEGWPRISVSIVYADPAAAIDWLCRAFGFEVQLRIDGPNGRVVHSQLVYGEGLIMIGSDKEGRGWRKSPKELGGSCTQALAVYVDDVDAHCAHARAAGAKIVSEPETTDHGPDHWCDRAYEAEDLDGHHWWFLERIR